MIEASSEYFRPRRQQHRPAAAHERLEPDVEDVERQTTRSSAVTLSKTDVSSRQHSRAGPGNRQQEKHSGEDCPLHDRGMYNPAAARVVIDGTMNVEID